MFWAVNRINNLIITINPNDESNKIDKVCEFDRLVNKGNLDLFKDFKLTSNALLRSGALSGNFFKNCFKKFNLYQI